MFDRESEIIAHFIGDWQQATEAPLLRLAYDQMRAEAAAREAFGDLLSVKVRVSSDLALDDFVPGLRLAVEAEAGAVSGAGAPAPALPPLPGGALAPALAPLALPRAPGGDGPEAPSLPVFALAPPASLGVVAWQGNFISDSDKVLAGPGALPAGLAALRTDAGLGLRLEALVATAAALDPFAGGPEGPMTGPLVTAPFVTGPLTAAQIGALAAEAEALAGGGEGPGTLWLASADGGGAPSSTLLLDGIATAHDLMPTTLADRLDAEDPTPEAPLESGALVLAPGAPLPDATHEISTGGNLLLNQAGLGQMQIDAGVIAVAGSAQSLTLVSQINLASDRDLVIGAAAHDAAPATFGTNLVSLDWQGAPRDLPEAAAGPSAFGLVEITGDLVLASTTIQINLLHDNDVVTFETVFHTVSIGTGDNLAANLFALGAFQSGFDMILVGGDMLSLISVQQLNLLFDDDVLLAGGVAAPGGAGNLLWNEVSIGWQGIDTAAEMTTGAQGALDDLAGGSFNPWALAGEAGLEGLDLPRILAISGDFITTQTLVQINILADADTVEVTAGVLAAAGMEAVAVGLDGNTLANLASLELRGTDSEVMAAGGVYSDVVIYQAGMYDDETLALDDLGSEALASEAVAFLAEGWLGPEAQGGGDYAGAGGGTGGGIGAEGCNSGTLDALGGVLV